MRQAGSDEWLAATVPGGIHTDLLALERIPDPFVGDNEHAVQWVGETDWEYRHVFQADPALLRSERVLLICDGLDTLAQVRLNDQVLGTTDNMFQQQCWDVSELMRQGSNELHVFFRAPATYAAERQRARTLPDVNDPLPGGHYLRKVPSHFGWDWGPKLAAIGIWRDIRLEGYTTARLDDVHIRQRHTENGVQLAVAVRADQWQAAALFAQIRLIHPGGQVQVAQTPLTDGAGDVTLHVDAPRLWWPNGMGDQPLYRLEVGLQAGETVLDTRTSQIGLRTIELRQQPDAWGRSFTFVVNGEPLFAKGANWIPADSFPTRVSHAQIDHLLGSAVAANHNMLRIWGGGYYEDEYLYDLCDRLGLLVWQDFMFACAIYPLNEPPMLASIEREVRQQVARLRHRACLALWCGNNEMETAWVDWGWGNRADLDDLKHAYDVFFHQTLPAWVTECDPDTGYWPSSPSSGTPLIDPNGDTAGDVHQWQVWHALKPFTNYRETHARFVSEFGFQSLPALATVATYARPEDWNMTSYVMEHHQKNAGGNGRIMTYLTYHFRIPRDFAGLVYLSQLLQAEAMRVGVEHWRRLPACSGALYWQLNDCWPVASWSSIDYYGRWKAAQYASRRFFAPLLLSIEDDADRLAVFLTSDARAAWHGELRVSLETLDGTPLHRETQPATVEPRATTLLCTIDTATTLTPQTRRSAVLVCELLAGGDVLQTAVSSVVPTKHLVLEDPHIVVNVEEQAGELRIRLQSQSLARFVELALDGADVIFSDNYFDLPAHRPRQITCPLPANWTLADAQAALTIRSVFDVC